MAKLYKRKVLISPRTQPAVIGRAGETPYLAALPARDFRSSTATSRRTPKGMPCILHGDAEGSNIHDAPCNKRGPGADTACAGALGSPVRQRIGNRTLLG
jgi:hypothetical protein